jgi:RHS repeat-associated protein
VAIVVQETHYDPWGLELAGIGYNAGGNPEHRWKFNGGVERLGDFGLHWDMSDWRPYDPQIGRFHGVDLLARIMPSWTPFHYGFNDPISQNDPTGLSPGPLKRLWLNIRAYTKLIFTGDGQIFYNERTRGGVSRNLGWDVRWSSGKKPVTPRTPDPGGSTPQPDPRSGMDSPPINRTPSLIGVHGKGFHYNEVKPPDAQVVRMADTRNWVPGGGGPSYPWETNPTVGGGGGIPGGPNTPRVISGLDVLREIAEYLVLVKGVQANDQIVLTGISTSFLGANFEIPIPGGTNVYGSVSAKLLARLQHVRQVLIGMGAAPWQVIISRPPAYNYGRRDSRVQYRFR